MSTMKADLLSAVVRLSPGNLSTEIPPQGSHMKIVIRLTPISALLACFVVTEAYAGASSAVTSAIAVGTSASSKTTSPDSSNKVVVQARDDAASFIASDGRIRGAQLEAALRFLRERNTDAQRASDMQLAQAILAL